VTAVAGACQEPLAALEREVIACRRCPRLVAWRELVARERRASFADQHYWGAPLPGLGDPGATVAILGLAPAAHGANRTGRLFTGDRSGDFLFAALHRAGLANQPTSSSAADGLRLRGVWITAAVRCAPPANRPSTQERENCMPWTVRELEHLTRIRVTVCLGAFAWQAGLLLDTIASGRSAPPKPRPRFAHGGEYLGGRFTMIGCYHPSQQNTFTGRLTEPMIDDVFRLARERAASP
jgi:uracil-DNA glycosylase family 4